MLNIALSDREREVVDRFHEVYYRHVGFVGPNVWRRNYWMGIETWKLPSDLWIYQELLHRIRPRVIVETGTLQGGSALFLAQMCDLLGGGEVITIDIQEFPGRPTHPRITYVHGSSIAPEIVERVRGEVAAKGGPVMVILDSNHKREHVLAELRTYGPLVTPGSYLIVEDSNVNGHPVLPEFGPGPWEAAREFLRETGEFEVDYSCEKLLMTFNPEGYLRRKAGV